MDPDELSAQLEQGYEIPDEIINTLLNRDVRAVTMLAVGLGWHVAKTKGVHLAADDGTTIALPTNTGLNFKVFRSRVRTVVRHGVIRVKIPLVEWVEQTIRLTKIEQSHAQVIRDAIATLTPEQHWQHDKGGTIDDGRMNIRIDKVEVTPTLEPPTPDPELAPVITREEPWSAHGRVRSGGSDTYPSDAVMERRWSDGTTDYACRWPDCDYVSDIPRSTAAHFGSHLRGQGRSPAPEPDGFDESWVPRQTARITKLRREIDGGLVAALAAGLDLRTPEFSHFLAQWIIDHRIESSGGGTGDDDDEGPLSLEQVVDKIAALADRGRSRVLREQIDTLNALLDESEGARRKAEGNLHALRDMLNED